MKEEAGEERVGKKGRKKKRLVKGEEEEKEGMYGSKRKKGRQTEEQRTKLKTIGEITSTTSPLNSELIPHSLRLG